VPSTALGYVRNPDDDPYARAALVVVGEVFRITVPAREAACMEVTRASFFAQTAQTSLGLIQNGIRKSAKGATPPLSMTSANLLKQSARNVGPVILIPENFNGIS
jgi:hypothetical protein